MRAEAKLPGRKWPWAVVAMVVVVAIVVAALVFGPQLGSGPTPAPTGDALPSSDPDGDSDPAPTGCLGGEGRDFAMVAATLERAPHTSNGGVEVAVSAFRFIFQAPVATREDAIEFGEIAVASSASAGYKDVAAALKANPNPSAGLVADGVPFYVSSIPGVWHLESASRDTVTVSVAGGLVVDGSLSPNLRLATTYTLQWENGAWRVVTAATERTTEEMYSIGIPFTEGC